VDKNKIAGAVVCQEKCCCQIILKNCFINYFIFDILSPILYILNFKERAENPAYKMSYQLK